MEGRKHAPVEAPAMSRPLWFVELVKKSFPARFFLARLTHVPGFRQLIDRLLFHEDDIIYLPRDHTVRIEINEPIATRSDVVVPSAVLEHFIDEAEYHWVMNFCICRAADGCESYPIEYGCLFLGEAVEQINPALGRRVTRQEAREHVQRCREAGLVHLVGRNKLDTMWLGAVPGHKLLTICNCCPCCCLWRVLPHIHDTIGNKVTRMPGVSVTVNDACKGCKLCTRDVCFVDAIRMEGKQAVIDQNRCRGCGRCVDVCPLDAIDLTVPDTTFVDASVGRIAPLVDLK
jgi:Pyruvate/2-oxoacid:ferredoxin oxidoreductase delta subunit